VQIDVVQPELAPVFVPKPVVQPAMRQDPVDREYALPVSNEAHSRLTDRMAQLAETRNSAWRRVLDAFSRKPDQAAGD
jgi:hypothetical protein